MDISMSLYSKHYFGVAQYMYEHADKYGLNREEMFVLGLLHDIGKVYSPINHEEKGAMLMSHLGYKMATFIAWHGTDPQSYMQSRMVEDIPNELRLLWEADMSIDGLGQNVGYEGRLLDIKERYGEESGVYETCVAIVEYLRKENEE